MFAGDASSYDAATLLAVNATPATLKALRRQGLRKSTTYRLPRLGMTVTSLQVPAGEDSNNVLARLHKQGLSGIMLNHYYQLDGTGVGQHADREYPYSMVRWPVSSPSCGRGVRIGMVDGSVDVRVPTLAHQRIRQKRFAGGKEKGAMEHGTAIAELLVGCHGRRFCGLMPEARLFAAVAFAGSKDDDPRATALAIVRSLDWLLAARVEAINLSFSGPDNGVLKKAIHRIVSRNIPLVAAAGNYGRRGAPAYPAAYPGVIAVTAVDQFHRPFADANQGDYIDFAAPGVRVPVPCGRDKMCYKSGTSFAAPYCTALVAGIRHRWRRKASLPRLLAVLEKNVQDLGVPGKDPVFGRGLVRCGRECRAFGR